MDKHRVDRLFDPTFNSCKSEEEFEFAWAIQARLADATKAAGAGRGPPPKDRHAILRRQTAERDAAERLRGQHERRGEEVHFYEEEDDPALAQVRAETPSDVRIDGWTADRRILFLELPEEHGSILAAARACGMSRRAVYRLLPRAPAFAAAFEAAMTRVTATLADTLFDRALNGHEVPVMHGGDVVATRTVHHDMLGLHLLRMSDPLNYAPPGEANRWLAGHGLKPLARSDAPPALSSPSRLDRAPEGNKDSTPATGDLCDLVQEAPPGCVGWRRATKTPTLFRFLPQHQTGGSTVSRADLPPQREQRSRRSAASSGQDPKAVTASGPLIVRAEAQSRQSSRMLALNRTRSPITRICLADMSRACSSPGT